MSVAEGCWVSAALQPSLRRCAATQPTVWGRWSGSWAGARYFEEFGADERGVVEGLLNAFENVPAVFVDVEHVLVPTICSYRGHRFVPNLATVITAQHGDLLITARRQDGDLFVVIGSMLVTAAGEADGLKRGGVADIFAAADAAQGVFTMNLQAGQFGDETAGRADPPVACCQQYRAADQPLMFVGLRHALANHLEHAWPIALDPNAHLRARVGQDLFVGLRVAVIRATEKAQAIA